MHERRVASNKRHLFVLILGQPDITQKYDCVSFAFCQSPLITVPRYTCILSANQSVPQSVLWMTPPPQTLKSEQDPLQRIITDRCGKHVKASLFLGSRIYPSCSPCLFINCAYLIISWKSWQNWQTHSPKFFGLCVCETYDHRLFSYTCFISSDIIASILHI